MKLAWIFVFLVQSASAMSITDRLNQASQYFDSARYDQVIAYLNPFSEELPAPGLMMLASAYSRKGRFLDEVRVLKTMAGKNEQSYEAQMLLGQAYLKLTMIMRDQDQTKGVEVKAIQAFRACLKLKPKFKPAFDALLAALIGQHAETDARELLVEGLEKFGHTSDLVNEMCRIDSTDGYVAQAEKSCQEAIHMSPGYPDNYVYLAQSLFDGQNNAEAEHGLVSAAHRFPASEFVQWAAGTVFWKKKNFPVSARFYGAAVKADANSARAYFGFAQSLYESGQEKEALPFWTRACHMNPVAVTELFYAAGSRLRARGQAALADLYKEGAQGCHAR